MPGRKIDFTTVREIGLALPEVEESTSYGSPSLKLRGRMMACMAIHKSAEPNSLGICMDFADRDELIAAAPETYYLTDHYVNYPCVLVRLSRIRSDALRDLLRMAWRFAMAKAKSGRRPIRKRRKV